MAPTLILLYKFGPELDRDTVTSLYINYGRSIDNSAGFVGRDSVCELLLSGRHKIRAR